MRKLINTEIKRMALRGIYGDLWKIVELDRSIESLMVKNLDMTIQTAEMVDYYQESRLGVDVMQTQLIK